MSKRASKPRKVSARKAEPEKVAPKEKRTEAKMPLGHVPISEVSSRHGTEMIRRDGRGFSLGELSGAGLRLDLARKWNVRTDIRRRTVLEGNVMTLKKWFAGPKPSASTGSAPAARAKPVRKKTRKTSERATQAPDS